MVTALPFRLPSTRLLQDVATTYAGLLTNALLGFVALMLMGRYLGPGEWGMAALANIFMAVIAGIAEPGLGTALVRLASRPEMTPKGVNRLIVASIRLKMVVVSAVCGLTYGLMPWITADFMHRPEITWLLRACLVGGGLLSLATFAGALFQIRGAFRDNAAAIAVAGAVRTVVVVALWGMGRLTLWTAVASMILMNVVQCGMCIRALWPMLLSLPWECQTGRQIREITHYGKHLVVWLLAGTIHPRADMLLLSHYASDNRRMGFYAAGTQLCTVVPMLTGAINLVLLPRISALQSPAETRAALRRCGLGAMAIVLLMAPLMLAARPLVYLVFGSRYGPAVLPFQVLFAAALVDLALNPFSNFWHALNRPASLSALNVARLSLLVGTAMLLIPRWGISGAAAAVLVSTAVSLATQGAVLWGIIGGPASGTDNRKEDHRSAATDSADPDWPDPITPTEVHA